MTRFFLAVLSKTNLFRFRNILLLAAFFITSCAPAKIAPSLTPEFISVAITPGARFLLMKNGKLSRCISNNSGFGVFVDEIFASFPQFWNAQLSLRMGEPDPLRGYAAQVGTAEIVFVANLKNKQSNLARKDLIEILAGRTHLWEQVSNPVMSGAIQVWMFPEGDESTTQIEQVVLKGLPLTTFARIAPDPEAMLQAVAAGDGALGYLPKPWLNGSVRAVQVDPSMQQALTLPVLSISSSEPQGAARILLGCLQSK